MDSVKKRNIFRRGHVDMTVGPTTKHLIAFAIPLLAGNAFQLFYNTVDTWVVGNFVSDAAFAAVGTVGPIINLLVGFFGGLATGAGVVISQFFGAKDDEMVERATHAAAIITVIASVLFTVIGTAMVPLMLRLIKTPTEVMPESTVYLSVYFAGIASLLVYNMGAGILRAVGDSTRPFCFLVVTSLLNIVLDLLFVIAFGLGVAGVALATVIAQTVSAVLVVVELLRYKGAVRIVPRSLLASVRNFRSSAPMLKKICAIGLPTAVQMAIVSFSNVFVQSYINHFGKECMAGWTAYAKIDQFVLLPMQSLAHSAATFVGQNLGGGQVERAKRGANTALLLALVCTAALVAPIMVFAPWLVEVFIPEASAVEYGALFLRTLSPFYLLCCVNQTYSGALRGSGNTKLPMFIMLGSFVLFRQTYLFVVANFVSNTVVPISMAYPAGWLVASVAVAIAYKFNDFTHSPIVRKRASADKEVDEA